MANDEFMQHGDNAKLYVAAADYGLSYHFRLYSLWFSSPFASVQREILTKGVGIFIKNTFPRLL